MELQVALQSFGFKIENERKLEIDQDLDEVEDDEEEDEYDGDEDTEDVNKDDASDEEDDEPANNRYGILSKFEDD